MVIIKSVEDWWKAVDDNWYDIHNIIHCYDEEEANDAYDAMKDRDWEILHHCLNTAWFNAPDSRHIHEIPGWSVLCELCSEVWVFDDRGKDD